MDSLGTILSVLCRKRTIIGWRCLQHKKSLVFQRLPIYKNAPQPKGGTGQ
jgi:hypothetical protein